MPRASVEQATAYHPPALGAAAIRLDNVLQDASDLVSSLSTEPPPISTPVVIADYASRAERAELRVFAYLWETEGFKTSTSEGIDTLRRSENYARLEEIEGIVTRIMGPFSVVRRGRLRYMPLTRG